jgi:hypothetical protein
MVRKKNSESKCKRGTILLHWQTPHSIVNEMIKWTSPGERLVSCRMAKRRRILSLDAFGMNIPDSALSEISSDIPTHKSGASYTIIESRCKYTHLASRRSHRRSWSAGRSSRRTRHDCSNQATMIQLGCKMRPLVNYYGMNLLEA